MYLKHYAEHKLCASPSDPLHERTSHIMISSQIVLGWPLTIIIAALVSAAFVSFGAYAPSKQQTDMIYTASKVK